VINLQLQTGEFKPYWELLNIFAYGTCKDYLKGKDLLSLPELSPVQTKKLQYLTIVTLSESQKCIPYKKLLEELSIGDIRELEDLIIEAIYAGNVTKTYEIYINFIIEVIEIEKLIDFVQR